VTRPAKHQRLQRRLQSPCTASRDFETPGHSARP